MSEPFKPTNDLEVAVWAAVERGDVEAYLHMLREATVVLPFDAHRLDHIQEGTAEWPQLAVGGQPHIPVFTSEDALLAVPDFRNKGSMAIELSELAKVWPDPEWRLAVNPGLPTAVFVPGSYARSTGVKLGARDPREVTYLPDIQQDGFAELRSGTYATQNPTEQALFQAIVAGDTAGALEALLSGTLFIVSTEKDGFTAPGQGGFSWITLSQGDSSTYGVWTSRERIQETMGIGHTKYALLPVSLAQLSDVWPDPDLALTINPGIPLGLTLPGPGVLGLSDLADDLGVGPDSSDFHPDAHPDDTKLATALVSLATYYQPGAQIDPASDDERALFAAISEGEREAFLRMLFNVGDMLWLSLDPERDPRERYGGQELPWATRKMGERTVLPVFTTMQIQKAVTGARGGSRSWLGNLLRYWPDPGWDLAINPGTAIGAVLPADQIVPLSEWFDRTVAHDLAHKFPVTDKLDFQLLDAGRRGDRAGFLEILRTARLWISSPSRDVDRKITPADAAFPWMLATVRGRPAVLAYTNTQWRSSAGGTGSTLHPYFGELAANWPASNPDFVLNPATPISITLTADEVRAFAAAGGS